MQIEEKTSALMTTVQDFASSWSLVGGRFDDGTQLEQAKAAKQELEQAIREALRAAEQVPVIGEPVATMLHFKLRNDDRWDRIPCLIGTESFHVSASLEQRTEPLFTTPATFITAADLESLRANSCELDAVCAVLPGIIYMDPPDGGSVSVYEQVRRMEEDASRYRWLRYNASYSIHEMLFGKPAFITTHKESDLDECIDYAMQERQP